MREHRSGTGFDEPTVRLVRPDAVGIEEGEVAPARRKREGRALAGSVQVPRCMRMRFGVFVTGFMCSLENPSEPMNVSSTSLVADRSRSAPDAISARFVRLTRTSTPAASQERAR